MPLGHCDETINVVIYKIKLKSYYFVYQSMPAIFVWSVTIKTVFVSLSIMLQSPGKMLEFNAFPMWS